MKKIKRLLFILCTAILFFIPLSFITAQTEQAQWSAVMAGETLCDPVVHGEYLYTLSEDQAVNCIDYTGSFVWRRNIERTIKPFLSVSHSGVLIIADSAGTLQAVSSQGIYLWSVQLPESVLYAPYSTTDGRICILTLSTLYCFSIKGKLKWQIALTSPPARQLCETGTASLLLTLTNKDFLTVSLTGQLLNTQTLKKEIAALAAAPAGYVMSTGDGTLTYYRNGAFRTSKANGTGTGENSSAIERQRAAVGQKEAASSAASTADVAVWQTQESVPLFMQTSGDELLCIYAGGTVSARNITSNTITWTAKLNGHISLPLYYAKTDGDYHIACKGIAAIIGAAGNIKRKRKVTASAFLPVILRSGILIAVDDWVVNSWRLDTKTTQNNPQQETQPIRYRLPEREKDMQTLPFFIPNGDTAAFLTGIEEAVKQDTVGTDEATYAFALQTVLANNRKAAYFPYDFTIIERARAAELLGLLESLEYRAILLEEAQKTANPTLAVSIIRALGFIAADPDGKSVESIQLLLRRCGIRMHEPAYAACDSLTEIAKYGDKQTAGSAVKALFAIAADAFPENLKQYARQKIKTIVE